MAYIANRPVRFDRDYAIGERIPDSVIDPKMTTKLISMGRIIRIADRTLQEGRTERAESAQDGDKDSSGTIAKGSEKDAPEGESDAAQGNADNGEKPEVYKCAVCGRTFTSANGLAAHSRTHKK